MFPVSAFIAMSLLTTLVSRFSLRSLVIAGFALSVLPSVLAVAFSFAALEEFARYSKRTAYRVAEISQKTQVLRERLLANERKVKQFLVLKEPALEEASWVAHRQVNQIISQLVTQTDDPGLHIQLQSLRDLSETLFREVNRLASVPGIGSSSLAPEREAAAVKAARPALNQLPDALFDKMNELGEEIGLTAAASIDRMVAELELEASDVQNGILLTTGILVPVSLLVIAVFIHLITHPVRQFDRAIRQLGIGNLQDTISVSGPSDLRYLGQRLEWLRDQLTTLEWAKQQFVRNVSHELKTPLANIHEGATLLADQIVGEINSEQRGIIEIMLSNTNRLEHLISELIHYGSASGSREGVKFQRVDMRELVRAVVRDYELRLRAKSVSLVQRLSPVVMSGNRAQLRLVVDNLLSNAVKYVKECGTIDILLAERDGYLHLEIRDDGPGVRLDERGLIFEPFYRSSSGRDAGVKGSGLGLAIVRECVASHQGKIDVSDAESGQSGAVFRVRMPIDPQV
ncbi:HAMP domain-containing histidine kinase [Methylolobus aquaticus]|nr:HAMP domain-containing histidine kinase [Methylolobus aquaticus]